MSTKNDRLFLITGATGNTGDTTVRLLLQRGHRVRAAPLPSPRRFCTRIIHDGRLRRESKTTQFLRLTKDENQIAVDKTS